MESYGPVVPFWVQIIAVMILIFALDKYDSRITIKLAGIGWGIICLVYLLIVGFKIEFLYNIISILVGITSTVFFFKIIDAKSKMNKVAVIAISFIIGIIWLIGFMFVLSLIFDV